MKPDLIRWIARILSLALFVLFAALVVGQGPPPLWPLSIHTVLFGLLILCFAGLLIAWRWQFAGGCLALVGITGFYVVHFVGSGSAQFPGGWVFPLALITAILLIVDAGIRQARRLALFAGTMRQNRDPSWPDTDPSGPKG
jgi:hypothetical protein